MTTAGRWDEDPVPYPDDRGVIARAVPGPVDPPPEQERVKQQRRDPGDPSCRACTESPLGYCEAHREFYHAYDPLRSVAMGQAADAGRGWRPV